MIEISAHQVSAFTQDGAVCLRGLFKKEWLEDLSLGMEKNVAEPGPDWTIYTPEGQPGQFYGAHSIMTDSHGNIYVTETFEGKRLQKFIYKGEGAIRAPDQGVVWPAN